MLEQLLFPSILSHRGIDAVLLLGGFKIFGSGIPQIAVWQNANLWERGAEAQPVSLQCYIAVQRMLMRASVGRVAGNIFLSHDSARRSARCIRGEMHRPLVIPLAIDEKFRGVRPLLGRATRRAVLFCVGDVYPHKRFELAIDALAVLSEEFPDLELHIAGRTLDEKYYRQMCDFVEKRDLSPKVKFLGHVPREELMGLYQSASLLIATSRLETFGLTPVEAMACGLPVVACEESAVPEVCGEAADYAPPSGQEIARVARRLLVDESKWAAAQQRGLRRSRDFSWPLVAEQYASVIESILTGGRARQVETFAKNSSRVQRGTTAPIKD